MTKFIAVFGSFANVPKKELARGHHSVITWLLNLQCKSYIRLKYVFVPVEVMKVYRGKRITVPLIFNFDCGWKWVNLPRGRCSPRKEPPPLPAHVE